MLIWVVGGCWVEIQLMKALVKNQPTEGYDYVEIPIPEPGAGDLLIRVERVSICGSDINLYKWNDGLSFFLIFFLIFF